MPKHRFGRGSLVLDHNNRMGIVLEKRGIICPWYWVEHNEGITFHYDVALKSLPSDWSGEVSAKLLRKLRGRLVMPVWLQGYCFGRKEGYAAGKFAARGQTLAELGKL